MRSPGLLMRSQAAGAASRLEDDSDSAPQPARVILDVPTSCLNPLLHCYISKKQVEEN